MIVILTCAGATDLLWTAPELLRTPPRLWPLYGTKAGDVFSFGILLHELVQHEGPYCIYSDHVNSRTVGNESLCVFACSDRVAERIVWR
jgi:hypothetical protein